MQLFFNSLSSPTNLAAFLFLIIAAIGGLGYIFSKVRKNDMDVLRNANTDLRASIVDNNTKITNLQQEVKILTSKVDVLERRNRTLEDLVVTALKQYFFENPKVASSLKDIATVQSVDNS